MKMMNSRFDRFLSYLIRIFFLLKSPGRPNWEEGPISDEEFTNDGAFVLEANIEENGKIDRKETSNGKVDRHVTSSSSSSTSATNPSIFFLI